MLGLNALGDVQNKLCFMPVVGIIAEFGAVLFTELGDGHVLMASSAEDHDSLSRAHALPPGGPR